MATPVNWRVTPDTCDPWHLQTWWKLCCKLFVVGCWWQYLWVLFVWLLPAFFKYSFWQYLHIKIYWRCLCQLVVYVDAHTSFVARILLAVFLLFGGGRGVDGNTCGYSLATPGIGYDRWMTTSLPYPPLTHIHCTTLHCTGQTNTLPQKNWQTNSTDWRMPASQKGVKSQLNRNMNIEWE